MNTSPRKTIFWTSAISLCSLVTMIVLLLLLDLSPGSAVHTHENPSLRFASQIEALSFVKDVGRSAAYAKLLLPVGPDEGHLPGLKEIWDEYSRVDDVGAGMMDDSGFDGIQAVRNIEELSKGSTSELFLSGSPLQVFYRGDHLLLLNDSGKIQIVACSAPQTPSLSGSLPYSRVSQMAMQGDQAYLLVISAGAVNAKLVVVNLQNPYEPREIAQLDLPDHTQSFFISDSELVVYTNTKGSKGERFVHLYNLTADDQLIPLGRGKAMALDGAIRYEDYLLVPDQRSGLHVIDFHDPLEPLVVASIDLPDRVKRLMKTGHTLFAMDRKHHMNVIDLRDPLHPVLVNTVGEANHMTWFMSVGHTLYYFTQNGYIRTFDEQLPHFSDGGALRGELVSTQANKGFTLIGDFKEGLPKVVTDVLSPAQKIKVVDALVWHGSTVLLHNGGLVQFFAKGRGETLELKASLKLSSDQRWLAATDQRLYVGGESSVNVVAKDKPGHFVVSGQIEFPGEESWDGVVLENTLCVAAGKDGIVSFSLKEPDRLTRAPDWLPPHHLRSQFDVRQLDHLGGTRLMVAAGPAGLLSALVDNNGQLHLDGFVDFPEPIHALAVVGSFCLVSTGADVHVIDIKSPDSLQNLGAIAFENVTKFAVTASGLWAGYVQEVGWSVFSAPRFVSSAETELLQAITPMSESSLPLNARYHLKLFNDEDVLDLPGIVSLSLTDDNGVTGAGYGLQ